MSRNDKNAICETCRAFGPESLGPGRGECRKSPPVVLMRGDNRLSYWPLNINLMEAVKNEYA